MISRRILLTGALAAPVLLCARANAEDRQARFKTTVTALEARHGGRLGVAIVDTQAVTAFDHRGDERFPLCSTFKFLAAAFVLSRVDRKRESLDRRIVYRDADLVTYSPVTEKHVGEPGVTIAEICDAAITLSDNTAGNLLLDSFGGPAGLTAYLSTLESNPTRLDRREPELNEVAPGDPRDTTTPVAMASLLGQLVLGNALTGPSREQLTKWLLANKTGDKRLRAGMPAGWRVADKTGSGPNNTANDVAVLWSPKRRPVIVAAFYTGSSASKDEQNAVLAEVGRLAAED